LVQVTCGPYVPLVGASAAEVHATVCVPPRRGCKLLETLRIHVKSSPWRAARPTAAVGCFVAADS
jgi:hypothetical protein